MPTAGTRSWLKQFTGVNAFAFSAISAAKLWMSASNVSRLSRRGQSSRSATPTSSLRRRRRHQPLKKSRACSRPGPTLRSRGQMRPGRRERTAAAARFQRHLKDPVRRGEIVVVQRSFNVAVCPAACSPVGFRLYSSDLPGGILRYVHWLPRNDFAI